LADRTAARTMPDGITHAHRLAHRPGNVTRLHTAVADTLRCGFIQREHHPSADIAARPER
jgi:hypothetical protein